MARSHPARRPVKNLIGLAVLSYLTQRPMHTYELHRQLMANDAASTFRLSYGALYSVVRQLLRAGFIAEEGTGRKGKLPEHTEYAITADGRRELDDWMRQLLAEPQHEFPAFAAALSLIVVLLPDDVASLLQTRTSKIQELRQQIIETKAGAKDVHPLFLVEDDYRLALLDAELSFIHELLERIGSDEWTRPWREYHTDRPTPGDQS
jgi:DNA-binding PadR family transcriptional regulator